jgi:predicted nucleic acid-binding protein
MRIVADASSLVAELLRRRGQDLVQHPGLSLAMPQPTWAETEHELNRRTEQIIRQGRMSVAQARFLLERALRLVETRVERVAPEAYAHLEEMALWRIPRDPSDWPVVAAALALDAGIWTNDSDFLGCGLPTWTTETLIAYLARHPDR